MRLPVTLFTLSALLLLGGGEVAGQNENAPAPQNELLSRFVDDPASFKGKTVTFEGTFVNRSGPEKLRAMVGDDGIPIQVYSPNRKVKSYVGLWIPKDFPAEKVPNAGDGDTVVVTFVCTQGKLGRGNKAVGIRRPE